MVTRVAGLMHEVALMTVKYCLAVGVAILMATVSAAAQTPPPIPGTTGDLALQGTMQKVYKAANQIVVVTIDGVEHVYDFSKDLIVHGGKRGTVEELSGLQPGTTVVVHYASHGATASATELDIVGGGMKTVEGMVTKIDRHNGQITVRYDNGTTETFKFSEHAGDRPSGSDVTAAEGDQATIYYTDDAGRKVVHYFKKSRSAR